LNWGLKEYVIPGINLTRGCLGTGSSPLMVSRVTGESILGFQSGFLTEMFLGIWTFPNGITECGRRILAAGFVGELPTTFTRDFTPTREPRDVGEQPLVSRCSHDLEENTQ